MDRKWEIVHRVLAEVHQDWGGLQVREGREHRSVLWRHRIPGNEETLQLLQGDVLWRFLKRVIPRLFFIYFCLFKQTIHNFCNKDMWKCQSSIWFRDLNPWPFEHESPPITTRPGLNRSTIDTFLNLLFFLRRLLPRDGAAPVLKTTFALQIFF